MSVKSENITQQLPKPVQDVTPAPPQVAPEAQPERRELQSNLGNAALVAASTNGPPPPNNNLSAQFPHQYGNAAIARILIQRKPDNGSPPTAPPDITPVAPVSAAAALIVEDNAEPGAGQMKKTEFLSQLRKSVSQTAADAFVGTPWTEEGCPCIERVFAYSATLDGQQIERRIRKFAPDTSNATTAAALIPIITARVQRGLTTWVKTGQVTEMPEGAFSLITSALAGTLGGAPSGIAGAANQFLAGAKSGLSGITSVLFKERNGGSEAPADPGQVQSQLGTGHSLDGGLRSRMESTFGESFSGVQVHTDANAAGISDKLNARAFTVGDHVAFGVGEYQPGTLIGDALIAHELAHVAQQRGGGASVESKQSEAAGYNALEEDADTSAVGAVVSLWGGMKGSLAHVAQSTMPRLKSGLKLQSCKKDSKPKEKVLDASKMTDAEIEATTEYKAYMDPTLPWQTTHKMTRDEALLAGRLIVRTRAEGKTVNWPADAEPYMNLARRQLGTLRQAEGLKGKLEWVQVSGAQAAQDPNLVNSDFTKWLLTGGAEPDATTGKVNCWEMVMFSAYKGGHTTKKRVEDIYNEGIKQIKAGTRSRLGDTIEIELRRGKEYVFDPKDPNSSEPLPGDIVIFTLASNHVAISLGTKDSMGRHRVISHWPPPDGSYKTKETTIEELLDKMDPGQVVKFWSPAW